MYGGSAFAAATFADTLSTVPSVPGFVSLAVTLSAAAVVYAMVAAAIELDAVAGAAAEVGSLAGAAATVTAIPAARVSLDVEHGGTR